jgi:hypothetical protein
MYWPRYTLGDFFTDSSGHPYQEWVPLRLRSFLELAIKKIGAVLVLIYSEGKAPNFL